MTSSSKYDVSTTSRRIFLRQSKDYYAIIIRAKFHHSSSSLRVIISYFSVCGTTPPPIDTTTYVKTLIRKPLMKKIESIKDEIMPLTADCSNLYKNSTELYKILLKDNNIKSFTSQFYGLIN